MKAREIAKKFLKILKFLKRPTKMQLDNLGFEIEVPKDPEIPKIPFYDVSEQFISS